jgi:predicted dehydrogenase
MVGFNRRFAPQVVTMKRLLSTVSGTKAVVITVNAGAIPADHWTQDPSKGGGRVVGEACHFIDLARHLVGAAIESAERFAMDSTTGDTVSLQLRHADGSISTIHYFANGHRAVAKERVEVYAQGRVLQLDNFRVLHGFGWPGFSKQRLWRQDKGQGACAAAFVEALHSGSAASIEVDELIEVSRWAVELG